MRSKIRLKTLKATKDLFVARTPRVRAAFTAPARGLADCLVTGRFSPGVAATDGAWWRHHRMRFFLHATMRRHPAKCLEVRLSVRRRLWRSGAFSSRATALRSPSVAVTVSGTFLNFKCGIIGHRPSFAELEAEGTS